jgi:AcrR family transcriptional regulator
MVTPNRRKTEEWRQRAAQSRRQQSRDRILNAARQLFNEFDYGAVSVEQIAKTAGVGPATVYNRFGSKAGVAAALFEEPLMTLQVSAEKEIQANRSFENMVHRHFQRLAKLVAGNRPLVRALIQAITEYVLTDSQPPAATDPRRLAPLPAPLTAILQVAPTRGVNAAHAAAMMTNALLIRLLNGDDPQTAARETADLLLYGICGQGTGAAKGRGVTPRRKRRKK